MFFRVLIMALILGTACAEPMQYQKIKNLPAYNMSDILKNSPDKKDPIIALYEKYDGEQHFACTAFVISDKLALTAGHCIVTDEEFLSKDEIEIRDIKLQTTKIKATPGAVNTRADLGIIVGDFSGFNKFSLALNPGGVLSAIGPIMTCGFAWGSFPVLCVPFKVVNNAGFEERGIGRLYPGMSGGPVIDLGADNIIGINTGVEQNGGVVFSPTVGLIGALELQVIK